MQSQVDERVRMVTNCEVQQISTNREVKIQRALMEAELELKECAMVEQVEGSISDLAAVKEQGSRLEQEGCVVVALGAIVYYWRERSAAGGGIITKPQLRPRLSRTKQSPLGGVSFGAAPGEPGHMQLGMSIRMPTPFPS